MLTSITACYRLKARTPVVKVEKEDVAVREFPGQLDTESDTADAG
jgi:hypothetical protein